MLRTLKRNKLKGNVKGIYPWVVTVYSYKRYGTEVISTLENFLYFPKSRFLPILYWNILKLISLLLFKDFIWLFISSMALWYFSFFIIYVFWETDSILLSQFITVLRKLCKRDPSPPAPEKGMRILDISHVLTLTVCLIWFNKPAVCVCMCVCTCAVTHTCMPTRVVGEGMTHTVSFEKGKEVHCMHQANCNVSQRNTHEETDQDYGVPSVSGTKVEKIRSMCEDNR